MDLYHKTIEFIEEGKEIAKTDLKNTIIEYATKERDFKRLRKQKMVEYRTNGLATTLCKYYAEGDDVVSQLEMEATIAKEMIETNIQVINLIKKQVDINKDQINREYKG